MRKFSYDAENKQTRVESINSSGTVTGTIGEYFYDGDGLRVKKIAYTNNQVTETTVFVYDASSRLVAEYSTILNPTPQVAYLTNDHLGSPRINTNELGAVISRHDYRPYGEEITERTHAEYVADTIRKQFTGYERDKESDLDFAQARYYNKDHGRFTTVDPLMASADIINPQTFNRYVYVGNNPINITDPTGEIWGVSGDTVRWFANEAAMRAEGFTAHVAQVAWSKDGTTMYALNPGSSTPVEVQSAAEVFRHLARWGAGSAAIGATAAALGVQVAVAVALTAAYVSVMTSGSAPDAGGFDSPFIGLHIRRHQMMMQEKADELANEVNQSSNAKGGNSSPADPNSQRPDPKDNEPDKPKADPRQEAAALGFTRRIPPQRAPFNSHGQAVYTDGRKYITRDVNSHKGGVWKMYDRRGRRLGTYDANLKRIGN